MTPHYKMIEVGGKELAVFYPQYKDDDGYKIIDPENRFPIELKNHDEYISFLETLIEREQELKDGITTLADLIEELDMLARGPKGDTRYMWVKYADDEQGNGMSDDPTGKKYIGFAFNKDTETPSDDPSDYKFVKYVADYEGLEIGGRNLLRNSNEEQVSDSSDSSPINIAYEITKNLSAGETYTLSFWAKTSNGTDELYIWIRRGENVRQAIVPASSAFPAPEEYQLFTFTFIAEESAEDGNLVAFTNRINNLPDNTGFLYVKDAKLEKGTIATDWTPAPEDIYALIDDIDAEHVGLGNVQNYGIASQSQAENGTSNSAYMTPLRTKQAIEALGGGEVIMGENENGTYEKYPSGLLICRQTVSVGMSEETGALFRSDAQSWEFPHEFISSDISVTFTTRVANRWGGTTGAISTDRVPYRIYGTINSGEYPVNLTAIGRWK